MEIQLTTATGQASTETVEVSDSTFSREYNEPLVHQVVTAYLAGGRQGTRAQKNRSQVRGGGAKPWRQKGTGRARAGTIRSPLWRSGGVTFAAKPQNHAQKVNKKMYRIAMSAILSELIRQERLVVVDTLKVDTPKTKEFKQTLEAMGLSDVLVVFEGENTNLTLASRNLPFVDTCSAVNIDPVSLIKNHKVLITSEAVKKLEGMLV